MIIRCKILYKETVAGIEHGQILEKDMHLCLEDVSAFSQYEKHKDLSIAFLNGKEMLIRTEMGHDKLVALWNTIKRNDKHLRQLN